MKFFQARLSARRSDFLRGITSIGAGSWTVIVSVLNATRALQVPKPSFERSISSLTVPARARRGGPRELSGSVRQQADQPLLKRFELVRAP